MPSAPTVSTGAVRLKLDAFNTRATASDFHWESPGATASPDRYELRISSGAVQVTLDEGATALPASSAEAHIEPAGLRASALEILLDGVESLLRSRSRQTPT